MPGYFVTQDTYHAGALKGIWRICQQTMIDTYLTLGLARLCDSETPITVADTFNARVLPFLEAQGIAISRVLAHRGTEYCGQAQGGDVPFAVETRLTAITRQDLTQRGLREQRRC